MSWEEVLPPSWDASVARLTGVEAPMGWAPVDPINSVSYGIGEMSPGKTPKVLNWSETIPNPCEKEST